MHSYFDAHTTLFVDTAMKKANVKDFENLHLFKSSYFYCLFNFLFVFLLNGIFFRFSS